MNGTCDLQAFFFLKYQFRILTINSMPNLAKDIYEKSNGHGFTQRGLWPQPKNQTAEINEGSQRKAKTVKMNLGVFLRPRRFKLFKTLLKKHNVADVYHGSN